MQGGQIVLVDTNIIIEAIRTGCWSALTGYFRVETVEKCREEARSGRAYRPGYITVRERDLRERLIAHDVTDDELARLTLRDAKSSLLDPGERHLWAHALSRADPWLASTADAAAVHAAARLGWEERLVALEQLVESCAARSSVKKLNKQFRSEQLSKWRTLALLERGLK
ncbi:MAG: hypothetical protein HY695_39260 [Deltaproteobacteria bacterium]|nr:hypothetical protein [Deltaproteobacteria bacterium]